METTLETRKAFGTKKTVPNKVRSTNKIYTIAKLPNSRLNERAAVEAEHKKAEAIRILNHSIRIR